MATTRTNLALIIAGYVAAAIYILQVSPTWRITLDGILIEMFVVMIHWTSCATTSRDTFRWWGAGVAAVASVGIAGRFGLWGGYVLVTISGLVTAWCHTVLVSTHHRARAIAVATIGTLTGSIAMMCAVANGPGKVVALAVGGGALCAAAELIDYKRRKKPTTPLDTEATKALAAREHEAVLRAVRELVKGTPGTREWRVAVKHWTNLFPRFAEHAAFRDARPLPPRKAENGDLLLPIRTGPQSAGLTANPEKLVGVVSSALHAAENVIGVDRERGDASVLLVRWRVPKDAVAKVGGWS